MDTSSSVKAGLKKSIFSAIKGTDRLLRRNNANVQQLQEGGMDIANINVTTPSTANIHPKLAGIDEKTSDDENGGNQIGTEVLSGGNNASLVCGESGGMGNRLRKRRSVSCEPTANNPTKIAPHQPAADEQFCCLQRAQSVNVVRASPAVQRNAVAPIAASSHVSSRIPSSLSICSCANSEVSARKRSPSGDDSLCSKEDRSLSSASPKINISICGKALYACASGRLDELSTLLKENPELVNYQYPFCYRYTCLHIAAKAGDFDIVRFLVKNGARLNAKDSWATPLHLAAQAGHLEMTRQLREMGADPTVLDAYGKRYCDYLPAGNEGLYPGGRTNSKKSKAQKKSIYRNGEDTDSISSSQSQNSLSLHQRFGTFKKPIGRAVSEFLHRK